MFPPFPQEIARRYCMEFISMIERGHIKLRQMTQVSSERNGHGLMIGSLVCNSVSENPERIVLHAVSGISIKAEVSENSENLDEFVVNGVRHIIVPPIADCNAINYALSKNDAQIHKLTEKINFYNDEKSVQKNHLTADICLKNNAAISELKSERKKLTDESLRNVHALYKFACADGKTLSMNDIIKKRSEILSFSGTKKKECLPQTGTGDCCAPKLLSYAFEHHLTPISLDEVYYGRNTSGRINGISYPPCDERCRFILPYMLGLEILYRDSQIVVVNKPSGLLSVPGRGEEKQDCVCTRLKRLFPQCIQQPSVHRLDMETSGILVLALTKEAHKNLNMQFSNGLVHKKYIALLDGSLYKAKGLALSCNSVSNQEKRGSDFHYPESGIMQLKFRLDVDNRPHQIYDEVNGKTGITEWKVCGVEKFTNPVTGEKKDVTRVLFIPHTGRTHQLRLASSDSHGFGLPIVGDTLYGTCKAGERLMLHACEIEFFHPVSGNKMHFVCESDF